MKCYFSKTCLLFFLLLFIVFNNSLFPQQHNHEKEMELDSASIIAKYKDVKDKSVREYMTNLLLDMIDKTKPTYKTWNTVCPVLGRPVNPKLRPIVYNEKAYGFCCKVCPPKFQENPEKFIAKLNKTGKKFIGKVE